MAEFGTTEQRRQLAVLAGAMVLAMSTWFSTAAVLGQLREAWTLDRNSASWLTIVVGSRSTGASTFALAVYAARSSVTRPDRH